MAPSRPAVRAAVVAATLVAAVLGYAPSLRGEFQFDDWTSVETNYGIRDPARVLGTLRPAALLGPGRPVTDLTFALDYAVAGLDPLAYHLTSLALHLATAALAFALVRGALRRIGHPRAEPLAAFTAAAFALHPLQTEAVCYVAQRAEVLSSGLYLVALLLFVRAFDTASWRAAFAWAAGATAATAVAMGAKTVVVTLPAAFLLWALALGRRDGPEFPALRRAGRAVVLGAGAWGIALGAVARNLSQLGPGSSAGVHAGDLGPWRYLLTQLRVHWHYARLLVWPSGQNVDPLFEPSPAWPDVLTIAAALATLALLGGLAWAAVRAGRARAPSAPALRAAAFGIAWWYLLLAPTSSVVPIEDLVAEHRAYLAALGALLAIAVAVDALAAAARAPGRARAIAAAAGVVACGALAVALSGRAAVWATQLSLWRDAAEKNPERHRVIDNYAFTLQRAGRRDEAIRMFQRAQGLARAPREIAATARNLGGLYFDAKDYRAAVEVLTIGVAADRQDFEVRVGLADSLRLLGRLDEAYAEALRAVSLAPDSPVARDGFGLVLLGQGDQARALEQFRKAAAIDPGSRQYREHVFLALGQLGRRDEACAVWAGIGAGAGQTEALSRSLAAQLACGR